MERRWGSSAEYEPVNRAKLNEYIEYIREEILEAESQDA